MLRIIAYTMFYEYCDVTPLYYCLPSYPYVYVCKLGYIINGYELIPSESIRGIYINM